MKRSSAISKAGSYQEIGEYWDKHDLSEVWDKTRPARFDVSIESEQTLCGIEKELSQTIDRVARERGVSSQTLVNLWLKEKVQEHKTPGMP